MGRTVGPPGGRCGLWNAPVPDSKIVRERLAIYSGQAPSQDPPGGGSCDGHTGVMHFRGDGRDAVPNSAGLTPRFHFFG